MLRTLLEGKFLKHPLHPVLVHLPIGLFFLSFLFDLATKADAGNGYVRAAFYSMLVGVIGALAAALPGFADYTDIRQDHPAKKTATQHMVLNLVAVALYIVNLLLRRGSNLNAASTPWPALILSLAGLGLINYSGYLGGVLVYDDGIGVGRHRRRTPTPVRTVRLRVLGTPDDFAPIADVADLPQGQTLRLELNDHVMCVVNLGNGEFRAFQEFCTHRYGPLSEGCLTDDGHVVCPWHRSEFDCRTGKPMHGPAKVDLKTYEVTTREGKIYVKVPPPVKA
jgi:uncharacterized membrane protein/nitrite reductase/ring-hydroxylating ferredoxin subunit